jgi:hypothetical protein
MKDLIYHLPHLDEKLSQAYNILSEAGFEILIEDGVMQVWPKGASIEMDMEEGMVIVPDEYTDEFNERQEELY